MTASEPGVRSSTPESTQTIKRRSLFAVLWTTVAAIVLKYAAEPAEATSGTGGQGSLVLGSNGLNSPNSATTLTLLQTGSNFASSELFEADARAFTGTGSANVAGLVGGGRGTAAGVVGILGSVADGFPAGLSAGVYGTATSGDRGVFGHHQAGGTGVLGLSDSGIGVQGVIPATSTSNAISVYGLNYSSYAGPGPGAGGFGMYGLSAKGHGLVGATAAMGAAAVVGATNGVAGAYAAAFYGPVIVGGALTVFGAKSAAVPHPDGSHRRLYCLESPESWFEDFGKGQLECGRAEITIDPDFAAVVNLDDYHVFLSERDTHQHLVVKDRTPVGFVVEADSEIAALKGRKDSDLSGSFSWRIVAKRKDITAERLATVTIPPEPALPPVPDFPTPPSAPDMRPR